MNIKRLLPLFLLCILCAGILAGCSPSGITVVEMTDALAAVPETAATAAPSQPETRPPTEPTVPPTTEMPTEPATEAPTQPPTEAPTETATEVPAEIPTAPPTEPSAAPTEDEGQDYVLNTNTHKFHYPSCSSVDSMKEKNKAYYHGTREEVIAMGYEPCGRCHP